MPIYNYRCNSCQETFEVFRSMKDKSAQACASCESVETKKLISSPNFVLKGDGWTGKNIRIRNQMRRKNARLSEKEREFKHDSKAVKSMTIAPNVDGDRVGSWSEAQKLAQSRGKDASSYNTLVRKERGEAC